MNSILLNHDILLFKAKKIKSKQQRYPSEWAISPVIGGVTMWIEYDFLVIVLFVLRINLAVWVRIGLVLTGEPLCCLRTFKALSYIIVKLLVTIALLLPEWFH